MATLAASMHPLKRDTAPVVAPTAAVRGSHWVTPNLVAEIAYAKVTSDGVLRHASYIGQREDKPADAVALEKVKRPQ